MTKFRNAAFALVAMALSFAFPGTALAQTSVAVFDLERIYIESQAGQSIRTQMQSIRQQIDAQNKAEASPINAELTALQSDSQGLSLEQIEQRPDLQQRAVSLQNKTAEQLNARRKREQEILLTTNTAREQIDAQLQGILEGLVNERGIDVVMERSDVVFAGANADITDDVISRLNAVLPSVTVTRQYLPQESQGQ